MVARQIGSAVLVGLLLALSAAAVAASFDHGPYSGAPSLDGVTVSWVCEPALPARIEYESRARFDADGTMTGSLLVPPLEEDILVTTSHATIEDLEPGTDYVYRVVLIDEDGEETVSPIGAFSTAPAPGEPVAFVVVADTQKQSEGVNRLALVADGIASDPTEFAFILHGGDVVEIPSSFYWDDWFDAFDEALLRAPFVPVLGNHEKNHRSYYDAFELPPGGGKDDERWWALHWGDVVVVGLDSNVKKASDYRAQQEWAREHLSGPEPHKFAIFHHPVFTSDAYHESGSFLDKIYHPIFVECGVDVVFNGHSHHYEHIVREGVTYLVVGGGGATPRQTRPEHIEGSDISVEGHYFYTRVHTSTSGIRVETISVGEERPDGVCIESTGPIDSFTLRPDSLLEPVEERVPEPPSDPEAAEDRAQTTWILIGAVVAALVVLLLSAGPE